jgi:Putative Flp pilus-assembly TadE/G-like
LSSTTERSDEHGQIIVLFAGALVALFLVAALAFDVGSMLLERRTEQNAADAAALAGARYVQGVANFAGTCPATTTNAAVEAACLVAKRNNPSLANADIQVNIPPIDGNYRAVPAVIQVRISTNRGSIFGGVMGRAAWPVGVNAVAANQRGVSYGFGMLALDPTACKAIHVSGSGIVTSAGNVQANSDGSEAGCGGIGLSRTGGGTITVTAPSATCRSAGTIQDQGAGAMTCAKAPNSFALPDPLRNLPAPPQPALALPMKEWTGTPASLTAAPVNVPDYCPGATGSKAPSATTPQTCVMGNGSQKDRVWVLYPGLYPGGLDIRGGVTLYLTPGIYWIGGGGFKVGGDSSLISVDDESDRTRAVCTLGATPPCTGGGGVLLYNSKLPAMAAGPFDIGGGGGVLSLMPYSYPFNATFINLVLFQDRTVALAGDDITLNGSSAQTDVRGIVYAPMGDVKVNGSASVFNMDQIIANTFKVNGDGGTVNVLRETGVDAKIEAVGLVE